MDLPLLNSIRQHRPDDVRQLAGPLHWVTDITAIPAAPATPTSPSPPSIGAMPARPRPPAAAPPRTALLAMPAVVTRAKPPGQTVTIVMVCFKMIII